MDKLTVFFFMLFGIHFLFMEEYSFRGITLKTENYPSFKVVGFLIIIICIYMLLKLKKSNNITKYTICPKCKETFNYDELKDGRCKYCEDIDTIDVEEYYKEQREKEE